MPFARPASVTAPRRRRIHIGWRARQVGSAVTIATISLVAAACSAPGASSGPSAEARTFSSTAPAATSSAPTTSTPASSQRSSPGTAATPESCAAALVADLSPAERAGQLLMVGLDANARLTSLDQLVTARHLGGVILLGGWYDGVADVRRTTRHLAGLAGPEATAGLGLLLAADQEGGAVQQLRGTGFTRFPSAREQGATSASRVTATATTMAKQLKAAGINLNLAPVADTVPTDVGRANQPIGRWGREFSSDPDEVGTMVTAFVKGMEAGGVASTIKHFPGIGRITGNTDLTATGITDRTATTSDPHLAPFATGIEAGADLVMVGSAIYSRLDPKTNAVFSKPIITDLLRARLGYDGVVITDDVGAAKAVAAVPPAERATRFVAAGGDIVLTARPSTIAPMHEAITARMAKDKVFAEQVEQSVTRVVALKVEMGLARCP